MAERLVNITLPQDTLTAAIKSHRRRKSGDRFALLQPIVGIECEGREVTGADADRLFWRVSDLGDGWLAGVLAMDDPDETQVARRAQPALSALLNTVNPQTLYPTLSELSRTSSVQGNKVLSVPTSVMFGDYERNMDAFIVGQELRDDFTHGWGEPTVRDFKAVERGDYNRYL